MSGSGAQLERIQRWFHASITHPGGSRKGVESDLAKRSLPASRLEDIVLPSNALNPTERLSIYGNMYFERLIDILAEEFPSVRFLLGRKIFADVVKDYVTCHPPTHYSLVQLGCEFPRYLLKEQHGLPRAQREFAAAVATVERTMEDVFDEQQVEPLSFDELETIPPDKWHHVRLKMIPALRLLQLDYRVNSYINAVRDNRSIDVPDASHSFVVVYRQDYQVWRTDLDERQFTLLSELQKGRTLGEAISTCAELPGNNAAALADTLNDWFRNWSAEGFFYEVEIVPD